MFDRATITLGIGQHFYSFVFFCSCLLLCIAGVGAQQFLFTYFAEAKNVDYDVSFG